MGAKVLYLWTPARMDWKLKFLHQSELQKTKRLVKNIEEENSRGIEE